jgi:hypothetical protein
MLEFAFFLDAWRYCMDHKIPTGSIQRKDWKTWIVSDTKIQPWVRA